MFTQYPIEKRIVAETDPVQCEQKQVLRFFAGITFLQAEQSSLAPEQKLFQK